MSTLQQRILQENDVQKLYLLQIEVSQEIKDIHVRINNYKNTKEQSIEKGNLGVSYSILELVKDKISNTKQKAREDQNEQNRINYNFRMAAKNMLDDDVFDQLMFLARKTRREAKVDMINLKI